VVEGGVALDAPSRARFPWRPDASSLLSRGLLAFLLACYGALIFIAVISASTLAGAAVPHWWLRLTALALFAATFRPAVRWLGAALDDLVYAQHDDPYVVIGKVDAALQAMLSPNATLPEVARIVARELRLPYVAIEADGSDAEEAPSRAAAFAFGAAEGLGPIRRLPIAYLDQPLGALLVAGRSPGRTLSAREVGLLEDIAGQVGIALYAVRLTRDVRASRERLVAAREEERRRIRHDLHDGLAPTLSALQLQAGGIARLMRSQPDVAEGMMDGLRQSLRGATAEIRRLVDGLRPPMLDELGLVGAVQHLYDVDGPMALDVIAPLPMPRLRAAVEVAAYRIASEAVHNAIRHSGAARCTVRFEVLADALRLEVSDDGNGLPPGRSAGVGTASMLERAAELGGTLTIEAGEPKGTRVVARLPLLLDAPDAENEPSTP